eukprot:COSAG05_NODE_690_length_7901_cov_174.242886_10_plen_307_part_00
MRNPPQNPSRALHGKLLIAYIAGLYVFLHCGILDSLGAPANADNFILFLAVGLSAIGLCALPAMNHTPKVRTRNTRNPPTKTNARIVWINNYYFYGGCMAAATGVAGVRQGSDAAAVWLQQCGDPCGGSRPDITGIGTPPVYPLLSMQQTMHMRANIFCGISQCREIYQNGVTVNIHMRGTFVWQADIFGAGLLPETPPYRYRILTAVCLTKNIHVYPINELRAVAWVVKLGCWGCVWQIVAGIFALFLFLPVGAGPHVYRSAPHPPLRGCFCCRRAVSPCSSKSIPICVFAYLSLSFAHCFHISS